MSPKAPTSAVPDRSEIGPYLGGLRAIFEVVQKAEHSQGSSLGRAISPKAPTSAVPDRSESGPYLRGLWVTSKGAPARRPRSMRVPELRFRKTSGCHNPQIHDLSRVKPEVRG